MDTTQVFGADFLLTTPPGPITISPVQFRGLSDSRAIILLSSTQEGTPCTENQGRGGAWQPSPETADDSPQKTLPPTTDLLDPLETTPEQQDGLEDQADKPAKPVRAGKDAAPSGEGTAPSAAGHATATGTGIASGDGSGGGGGGLAAGASASQPPAVSNPTAAQGAQFWMTLIAETGQGGPAPTVVIAAPPAVNAAVVQTALAAPVPPPAPTTPATTPSAIAPASQPSVTIASAASHSDSSPTNGSLVPIDPSIAATEGTPWNGLVAQFGDSDSNTNSQLYSANISYADGTHTVPGTVAWVNGVFDVYSEAHDFPEEGSFSVSTSVYDTADSNTTTIVSPATVTDAPVAAPGSGHYTLNLTAGTSAPVTATYQDSDSAGTLADYSASINFGDGTTATPATIGGSGNKPTAKATANHTYSSPGTYTILATLQDSGGASAVYQLTANVASPALALTNPGTQNNVEGDNIGLQLNATDGGNHSLTFSAGGLPAGLTLNSSTGFISGRVSSGDSSGSPYPTAVTVTDGTTNASQQFTWNVSAHSLLTLTNPGRRTTWKETLSGLTCLRTTRPERR